MRWVLRRQLNELKETCDPSSDECQHKLAELGAQLKILEWWKESLTLGINAWKGTTVAELKKRWVTAVSNTGAALSEKFDTHFKDRREHTEELRICRMQANELHRECRRNVSSDECSDSKIAEINAQVEALDMREESLAREGEALWRQAAEEMRRLRRRKWVIGLAGAIGMEIVRLIYNRV